MQQRLISVRRAQRTSPHGFDVSTRYSNSTCSIRVSTSVFGCFRHQLLLPRPYLVLTKPLRLDIRCQRGASVKIGWKYLDD